MKYKRRLRPAFLYFFITVAVSFTLALLFVGLARPTSSLRTDNITTDNYEFSDVLLGTYEQADYTFYPVNNFDLDYEIERKAQPSGTVRIPILTYHQIAQLPSNPRSRDYFVSPEMLDQQMAYLSDKGYKTLTPKEFYDILASGKNPEQKSIWLTFDDGNYNNYQNAFPILKKYKMTGTFYVPSHRSGIKASQLKEMTDAGMVIDPHGKTHMLLRNVTNSDDLYQELVVSKGAIQSMTGNTVYSFCYPGCEYNGSVTSTLASNGYLLGVTCGRSIDHKLSRRFSLERIHVYNDMQHFKSILSGVLYYPSY